MLQVSLYGHLMFFVKLFLVDTLEDTFGHSFDRKFGQNDCLGKILDDSEFGSPGVINYLGHHVKLKKYLVGGLEATFCGSIVLKFGQAVCFDKILDEVKFG